jgi:diguanylate cyclase (GGDEF)-like protein
MARLNPRFQAKRPPGKLSRKASRVPALEADCEDPAFGGNRNRRGPVIKLSDLSKMHLLRHVSLTSVWGLLESSGLQYLNKGEVLVEKGQENLTLYLIVRGQLNVILEYPAGKPVAVIDSGQSVGEMSVIDHRPTSAFVVATQPTIALAIEEDTFWRLIVASHQFAKNLFLLLTQRLRASNFTIAENMRLRKLLEHDVSIDALTGLRNRRWLDKNLSRLAERFQRSAHPLSVIMLDIDFFKKYNDAYGHGIGDRVLSSIGRVIEATLRATDYGVRYGGEEFLIILPDTDLAGGIITAERLRKEVQKMPFQTDDGNDVPHVTVSLGVAQMGKKEKAEKLVKRADAALYRAKKRGRNRTERSER